MKYISVSMCALAIGMVSCGEQKTKEETPIIEEEVVEIEKVQRPAEDYLAEDFADIRVHRYFVNGWDELTLEQKKLLYYLHEAAMAGRDIVWDQNYKHNLRVRKTLENILNFYEGDKTTEEWNNFVTYSKRVFVANGIHHHYSMTKFKPTFSYAYFTQLVNDTEADWPLLDGESKEDLLKLLEWVIFDPTKDAKRVNKSKGVDMIAASACNFYEGLTQKEVEDYYKKRIDPNDTTPVEYGHNSKLVKVNGKIEEKVWKVGGMYSTAIEKVVHWLDKAATVAENETQQKTLELLSKFYRTGSLEDWDTYNITWVTDTSSVVDVINGFIEVYGDPLGYRATFESVVSIKDFDASRRMQTVSKNAQWFEDNSSILPEHKKKQVKGVSYKVIEAVVEGGDCHPTTPIGINLPNSNWIRKEHGSKSVSLGNITLAYDKAAGSGFLTEFAHDEEEIARAKEYGELSGKLHTALHEVIGHASGQINPGIGTPKETLKNYASTLEEGRADLVALYYLLDPKLIELGLMPSLEVGKAEYDSYIRNGLMTQLRRIEEGEEIEEDHMRNRQMVAAWAFEKGAPEGVIVKVQKDGKTYFDITDYEKLRVIFGDLLREVQRIKSEGDYEAGRDLVENYGVKVDTELHKEVLARSAALNIPAYGAFINPKLIAETNDEGEIVNVHIEYPTDFLTEMLEYGKMYANLPIKN
ncbi:dihydrofolate reductase [bacterium]|nr:dihydrofolate reductase [bacterium]